MGLPAAPFRTSIEPCLLTAELHSLRQRLSHQSNGRPVANAPLSRYVMNSVFPRSRQPSLCRLLSRQPQFSRLMQHYHCYHFRGAGNSADTFCNRDVNPASRVARRVWSARWWHAGCPRSDLPVQDALRTLKRILTRGKVNAKQRLERNFSRMQSINLRIHPCHRPIISRHPPISIYGRLSGRRGASSRRAGCGARGRGSSINRTPANS